MPQIHDDLLDTYQIILSRESIRHYIYRYQTMLAARQQDPQVLADEYRDVKDLILSIDGLQPEKGHETLYVVRELRRKRVWFAESLISSSAAEVRRILVQARQWAEQLGLPVRLWVSDKQDAFVSGIATEFPGTSHRYCENHFLRDVAEPVLEIDSQAKVKMRSKVRGLRAIERDVLAERREQAASTHTPKSQKLESQVSEPRYAQAVCAENSDAKAIQHDAVQECCEQAGFTDTLESQQIEPQEPKPRCVESNYAENPRPESVKQDVLPCHRQENTSTEKTEAGDIVLAYCTAVRSILNSSQGGPLSPPGLRMAEALSEVRVSLQRNLEVKKGALTKHVCDGSPAVSTMVSRWSKPNKSN